MVSALTLIIADLENTCHRAPILEMSREYIHWMSREIQSAIDLRISEIFEIDHEVYLTAMLTMFCGGHCPDNMFQLAECDGETAGMGGLQRHEEGSAEIVRIYMRPAFRGEDMGTLMVSRMAEDARRFGYHSIRLDVAPFMTSAQWIYRAAGFGLIAPYAGAEPPEVLQLIWLYMEKRL